LLHAYFLTPDWLGGQPSGYQLQLTCNFEAESRSYLHLFVAIPIWF
jgi:hypothetical protein